MSGVASLQTTLGVVIASSALVTATPPRPGQDAADGRAKTGHDIILGYIYVKLQIGFTG